MNTHNFNAPLEAQEIQRKKAIRRRKLYRRSCLIKYQAEIVALRKNNLSYHDIASWLKTKKRLKVSHTTIMRFVQKLPEYQALQKSLEVIDG